MNETFLPWWLVLLFGMWATALAIWQHPSLHREVRLWAGLSTLIYLVLIFLVLAAGSRLNTVTPQNSLQLHYTNISLIVCVMISLTACVWFVGHVTSSSRRLSYVVLTLANSGVAALLQVPEIAIGLLIVALISAKPLIQSRLHSRIEQPLQKWFRQMFELSESPVLPRESGEIWLVGLLSGILACAILGTFAFSLRIETSRTIASPRYSALPARANLERTHSGPPDSNRKQELLSIAFGPRSEIVVLLAVVVFLCLAINLNDAPRRKGLLSDSEIHRLPQNPKKPPENAAEGLA